MEDNNAAESLAENATVTDDTVTDEALTAALEGKEASEPEVTVKAAEAEPEGQDGQDGDHAEKTRLGRKVKKLEDVMVTKAEFSQLMAKFDTFMTRPAEQVSTEQVDMPEYVTTPDDVEKVIQARESRQRNEQETYQRAYVSQMVSMSNGND